MGNKWDGKEVFLLLHQEGSHKRGWHVVRLVLWEAHNGDSGCLIELYARRRRRIKELPHYNLWIPSWIRGRGLNKRIGEDDGGNDDDLMSPAGTSDRDRPSHVLGRPLKTSRSHLCALSSRLMVFHIISEYGGEEVDAGWLAGGVLGSWTQRPDEETGMAINIKLNSASWKTFNSR